jgi:hypothetical protein
MDMKKSRIIDTRALRAGQVVSSTVKQTGQNVGEGTVHIAKGIGFGAKQFANIVADFGRGLKRGWQR